MSNQNKVWCVDPFVQMAHTADGFYRVCCIGEVDRNSQYNTKNMTPEQYWNSAEAKQIRDDMISGNFSRTTRRACAQCIANEKSKIEGRRYHENNYYGDHPKTKANIDKHKQGQDLEYKDLIYVNFKVLGNICNLKCLMCGNSASSKIAAESKKYGEYDGPANLEPFNSETKSKYFNELRKVIKNVDRFNLVGGENFIHPDFEELFQIFLDRGNLHNFELHIISNATDIPEIIYKNAHKFKRMSMTVSIEGVEGRGSYIRSGLNWNDFDNNVNRLVSTDGISLSLITATQFLNIGYLDEVYDYVKSKGLRDTQVFFKNLVTNPAHWRAVNLPKHLKQQYKEKLQKHPVYSQDSFRPIIKILEAPTVDENLFLLGIEKLKITDQRRGTHLLDYFPEFTQYYTNC